MFFLCLLFHYIFVLVMARVGKPCWGGQRWGNKGNVRGKGGYALRCEGHPTWQLRNDSVERQALIKDLSVLTLALLSCLSPCLEFCRFHLHFPRLLLYSSVGYYLDGLLARWLLKGRSPENKTCLFFPKDACHWIQTFCYKLLRRASAAFHGDYSSKT